MLAMSSERALDDIAQAGEEMLGETPSPGDHQQGWPFIHNVIEDASFALGANQAHVRYRF